MSPPLLLSCNRSTGEQPSAGGIAGGRAGGVKAGGPRLPAEPPHRAGDFKGAQPAPQYCRTSPSTSLALPSHHPAPLLAAPTSSGGKIVSFGLRLASPGQWESSAGGGSAGTAPAWCRGSSGTPRQPPPAWFRSFPAPQQSGGDAPSSLAPPARQAMALCPESQ